jgi:8-oxo-dGTP diphosphatase
MITVNTFMTEQIPDELWEYAVIAAKYQGKWVFCRHKKRTTWEIPGGHREAGESVDECARRELYEETGAVKFELLPIQGYSASDGKGIGYGVLYYAEITELSAIPSEFEIGEIQLCEDAPRELTYPEIQGHLFAWVCHWLERQPCPIFSNADSNLRK